jgi:sugar lactone lactonase YvrE
MTVTPGSIPHWTATVASRDAFDLAEGPVWDAPRDRLVWVDIDAGRIHEGRLIGDEIRLERTQAMAESCGAVAISETGDMVVAGRLGTFVLTADGERLPGHAVLDGIGDQRLNDGKCDPAGRFIVGSLERSYVPGSEAFVRCEPDGSVTVLDDDLGLSNGLGWSPDERTMYSIDSTPGTVWARSYDAVTGEVGPRRSLIEIRDGTPDGMCVDTEGHLWIAIWGGGQVRRYTPDGVLAGILEVASFNVTCPVFAGPDRDVMVITTATQDLAPELLAANPDAGKLFVAHVGQRGLPETPWAGHR